LREGRRRHVEQQALGRAEEIGWNMATSSAADISAGSAKKLRENTSRARARAAAGNRTRSR
jgi:hypothetical protein